MDWGDSLLIELICLLWVWDSFGCFAAIMTDESNEKKRKQLPSSKRNLTKLYQHNLQNQIFIDLIIGFIDYFYKRVFSIALH